MKKRIRSALCLFISMMLLFISVGNVQAVTIEELQREIEESQRKLNNENAEISEMQQQQDILEEEISDLDAELVNLYTEISVLEDEIAEQEDKITEKEGEIGIAEEDLAAAEAEEQRQYAAMKQRIKYTYEQGESSYVELLLSSRSISDLLNRAEFIEEVASYDDRMLDAYQAIVQQVAELKANLEEERVQLIADKEELEATQAELADQQSYLNGILAKKKAESANYDAEIAQAKKRAAQYKKQIADDTKKIKQIQEEERRRLAAQNGSRNYTPSANAAATVAAAQGIVSQSGGSSKGKEIASYACRFIGNPYVAGGTSLTNGADCSGFTYRVYADFGYSIPRNSYAQRSAGTGVSYSEAQPGDLICYEGHVGMYIGGGMIVHASTERTGIRVTNAQYRGIVAVRRIV